MMQWCQRTLTPLELGGGAAREFAVPATGDVYSRERLFRLLDDSRATARITWVGAPSGSGKTTLVASYVKSRALPCVWYRAQPNEPAAAFAGSLKAALAAQASPSDTQPLLVIDDLPAVEMEAVHELLCKRLADLPPSGHAILIATSRPSRAYARLSRNGRLKEIDARHLRLTADEAQALERFLERARGEDRTGETGEKGPGAAPQPIKVFTLGRFGVAIDGRTLTFGAKAQRKPLALLKALIAFGGRSIREERLLAALWPDADTDRAALALTSAVHRLRKLIGHGAIERREGRITLCARVCWVDAWSFERMLAAAERRCRTDDAAAIERLVEDLLAAYRGPFLVDQDDDAWLLTPRERIRSRLLRVLGDAADALGRARRHDQAARCLEKALDVDPLAERTYRRLMQLHLERAQWSEALAAYGRCRAALAAHFGVAPSPETEAIRRQIAPR